MTSLVCAVTTWAVADMPSLSFGLARSIWKVTEKETTPLDAVDALPIEIT
jgi:hypothetical protein